jgi:hypothetical protein
VPNGELLGKDGFQRDLETTRKVRDLAEEIKHTQEVPGTLLLGVLNGEKYLVDGQHRREAFFLSGLVEAIFTLKITHFRDFAEMSEAFTKANEQLRRMTPDDRLRALAVTHYPLQRVTEECPWVGYSGASRRKDTGAFLSMSAALHGWVGSSKETPSTGKGGVIDLARGLSQGDAEELIAFLKAAYEAWARIEEYFKLWGEVNLIMCMWLWRRAVRVDLDKRSRLKKSSVLTRDQFVKGLRGLAANDDYLDWLPGKRMGDRDRGNCYTRIKQTFIGALGSKIVFPQPSWYA